MRTATKLHGVPIELGGLSADLYDTDDITVFVTEELEHILAILDLGVSDFNPSHLSVLQNALIDQPLDVHDLRRGQRGTVEVERQLLRSDVGPLLGGFLAGHFMESPMQQVSHRMVTFDGMPTVRIDAEVDR